MDEPKKDNFFWENFERYCIWLSLPKQFSRATQEKLEEFGFDEESIELIRLPTRKAFSEKYNIPTSMLAQWDNDPKAEQAIKDHWRRWAKRKTPNVVGKLYEKIMEEGDAARIKVWQSFVEQQADKLDIDAGLSKVYENMKADGDK